MHFESIERTNTQVVDANWSAISVEGWTSNEAKTIAPERTTSEQLQDQGFIDFNDPVLIAGNPLEQAGKQLREKIYNVEHPGRKNLDAKVDYHAAHEAYQRFRLEQHGVDPALIPALIRNEQYWTKAKDKYVQDPLVEDGDIPKMRDWTIGPAQMKVRTMEYLVGKYPKELKELVLPSLQAIELSGMRLGEREASVAQKALEPRNAALLVGAYLADKIDRMENGHVPCPDRPASENERILQLWASGDADKRTEALIRTYNPHDREHVKNVLKQMTEVRTKHPEMLKRIVQPEQKL